MIFYVLLVQFVVPGVTKADSSEFHISQLNPGTYPYWPNRTVDGNFSQTIKACLHTADKKGIREAWLRIDLETVKSVKSIKFWYRADSKYSQIETYLFMIMFNEIVSNFASNSIFDMVDHSLKTF